MEREEILSEISEGSIDLSFDTLSDVSNLSDLESDKGFPDELDRIISNLKPSTITKLERLARNIEDEKLKKKEVLKLKKDNELRKQLELELEKLSEKLTKDISKLSKEESSEIKDKIGERADLLQDEANKKLAEKIKKSREQDKKRKVIKVKHTINPETKKMRVSRLSDYRTFVNNVNHEEFMLKFKGTGKRKAQGLLYKLKNKTKDVKEFEKLMDDLNRKVRLSKDKTLNIIEKFVE